MRIDRRRGRIYVRRRGPCPALWLVLALVMALAAFVFFARPAIQSVSVNLGEAPASGARVTREVRFADLSAHLVELARTSDQAQARVEAARYVARGAAGYVLTDEAGSAVIGNAYDRAEDARKVKENLLEAEKIEARVRCVAAPELTLRITGTDAQMGALTGGEDALRALTGALSAHALALDQAEVEPLLIRAALSIEAEEAERARARLAAAAGATPNPVAETWMGLLDRLKAACEKLSRDEQATPLTFSSQIKYAFVDMRLAHIAALAQLAGGG
ncbi:MAG: hypothetical protein RSA12_08880 [Clostridia bacterium]